MHLVYNFIYMFKDFIALFSDSLPLFQSGLGLIFEFYYIWLPILLIRSFWKYWKKYVVADALLGEKMTLIQMKLPREINKSPKAMELFLQNLFQTGGEGDFYKKHWKGGTRPWFSLEIVSIEGEVRFYIHTRQKFADLVEVQIYAQYPEIEVIVDAPDYTKKFNYNPLKNDIYGSRFILIKPDPYPIKSYVDFGLDDDAKIEFRVDPIASVIESLGSLGRGEHLWIQILIRAHKKPEVSEGIFKFILKFLKNSLTHGAPKDWVKEGRDLVEKLKEVDLPKDPDALARRTARKTKQQERIIEAVERSISKQGFDCIIRGLYLADKDSFNPGRKGTLLGAFQQYNSDGLNGFKPEDNTEFDFPWQDFRETRTIKKKKELFEHYVKRAHYLKTGYMDKRYNVDNFILNTEEIATIFHFPSSAIETPTLPRIPSKKAEPPTNLPI
jgi:hypothetical protein